jgi:hypothetical protein
VPMIVIYVVGYIGLSVLAGFARNIGKSWSPVSQPCWWASSQRCSEFWPRA